MYADAIDDGEHAAHELDLRNLVVVVHDWLTEFQPSDVPACLQEVHGDVCDALGSMSRVFEVKP